MASPDPQVVGQGQVQEEEGEENVFISEEDPLEGGKPRGKKKKDKSGKLRKAKSAEKDGSPERFEEVSMILEEEGAAVQKISAREASYNLITCMIGASVLGLPHVVSHCGLLLGPLLLALAGLVSFHGCLLVDRAMDATFELKGVRPRNLGDVAEFCFGRRGKIVIVAISCIFQILKCGVFILVIGTNVHFWGGGITKRQCTLIATLLSLRMAFLRDITVISRWSVIGVVSSVFYFLTISAGGMQATIALRPEERQQGLWPLRYSEVPAFFAVMLYAYSPADVIPILKNDMAEPGQLPWALWTSHLVVAVIYIGLSAAACFGWGSHVEGNVLESMCDYPGCPGTIPRGLQPGAKWSLGYVLSVAVISNLIVTIPVVMYCTFKVLELQFSKLRSSRMVNFSTRLVALFTAVSLALFVPFFIPVLSVLSTALLVALQVFLPVALILSLKRKGASVPFGVSEFALLVLGVGVFFVGLVSSLRNLIEAIEQEDVS